ncbi:MAG: PqqD family protein [Phycisphaeraceae bacterium]|nr:PqqD family protein [Phycisphaeraceae bacterium]
MLEPTHTASPYPTLASDAWQRSSSPCPCPVPRSDLVLEQLDDEAVLFDPRDRNTYRLNQTAVAVWTACRPGRSTHDVAAALLDAYDVEPEQAMADVIQLIACWTSQGLMTA